MEKSLLNVIKGKEVKRIPVWIMRQAGRYLPAYQKLRKKYDFLTLCQTPELAAEVTLQPVEILDVDAAILFSDILIPCLSLGFQVQFVEGKGPVVHNPVTSVEDIRNLNPDYSSRELESLSQTVKFINQQLPPEKALIGFTAAPFSLACYLIEGASSKNFLQVKSFLYDHTPSYRLLMEKVSEILFVYLKTQAEAGAEVLQLFDTWGGILSPSDFEKYVFPFLNKLIREVKKEYSLPLIYFMKGSGGFLSILKHLPVEVMSIDWTLDLERASESLEDRFVLQGNLDPAVLLSRREIIREKTTEILQKGKKVKGHIFNLGHGILPSTPVAHARYLVETVHNFG
ncbi:uroporphyrinogen decarboxylase [bacterium]|nr:uroporphyrinogen decarboxylase [bacterium]